MQFGFLSKKYHLEQLKLRYEMMFAFLISFCSTTATKYMLSVMFRALLLNALRKHCHATLILGVGDS